MVNGAAHGFFKSFRGLRQGNPLSPALFVIAAEVLSRGLNNLAVQPSYLGFTVPQGCPGVTHLAFADDVLILANGSATALRRVMRVLDAYQRSSGQMLNVQKSGYLVHPSLSVARRRVIESITGFSRQAFPTRYLGFPLYIGRLMPKAVFRIIERACANFLWGSSEEGFRYHWIGWNKLCFPPEEGGVGFRRLRDVYTAFSYKLWWQFRTGSSLWTTFMRAKYCWGIHPCQAERKLFASATWRRMQDVSRQVELSMLWLVQDGSCHFWYDNWLGSGALFLRAPVVLNLSFRDFIIQGHWNVHLLSQVLPMDITAVVLSKSVPDEQSADEVVWMPARSGKFSLASAYQEVAEAVWGFFEGLCGISSSVPYVRARLASWWLASPRLKRRQAIYHILSSLICWHLWKVRNRAVFEGIQPQSSSICQVIFRETKVLLEGQLRERVEAQSFLQLCEWATQPRGRFGFKLCPWHIRGEVRQIWNLVRDPSRFSHCFREANKVADALANIEVAHPHQAVQLYEHWSDWPQLARGGVSLDSMWVPSLRTVRNP
nr:uncharacterized protein LOC113717098 [Coffea arabica]